MPCICNHGGGCCGILHIYDFDYYGPNPATTKEDTKENIRETIRKKMASYYETNSSDWNCLVEAVLTTGQVDNGWGLILTELGFKEVTFFRNSNSGNVCHVFHLQTQEMK